MYFPYLRGRQYELIAIRDLLESGLLSIKVVPLIEPVKLSSTFISTLSKFKEYNQSIAVIANPSVGTFLKECTSRMDLKDKMTQLFKDSQNLYFAELVSRNGHHHLYENMQQNINIAICKKEDDLRFYVDSDKNQGIQYTVMPNSTRFGEHNLGRKVKLEDKFQKRDRNADYLENDDEFFSEEHIFYLEDGYVGFSDYTIVGDDYSEAGFAPYAVAIHIVYFDRDNTLRVKHFVSDSNTDITNPAGKFSEALEKMIMWITSSNIKKTYAIKQFEKLYETQTYPGLGVVKKLSIMHHLELISEFLDGKT